MGNRIPSIFGSGWWSSIGGASRAGRRGSRFGVSASGRSARARAKRRAARSARASRAVRPAGQARTIHGGFLVALVEAAARHYVRS